MPTDPPVPCRRAGCNALIRWARTAAGKAMPVDPEPYAGDDERANLAVMRDGTGRLVCRVITAEAPLLGYERRAMPHWATCAPLVAQAAAKRATKAGADNVVPIRGARP